MRVMRMEPFTIRQLCSNQYPDHSLVGPTARALSIAVSEAVVFLVVVWVWHCFDLPSLRSYVAEAAALQRRLQTASELECHVHRRVQK